MVVYHVTSLKKLNKYLVSGKILPLKFPDNAPKLEGHFNQARVLYEPYILDNM